MAHSGERDSAHKRAKDSLHTGDSLHKSPLDSLHTQEEVTEEELLRLQEIAASAASSSRLPAAETRRIIAAMCEGRFLTATAIAELMKRNVNGLRLRFLTPMVEENVLERKYPGEPNRPDQAYRSTAVGGTTKVG